MSLVFQGRENHPIEFLFRGHFSLEALLIHCPPASPLAPYLASRNNSASQADYKTTPKSPLMGVPPPTTPGGTSSSSGGGVNSGMPFKPVPPPKPKNYRPPMQNGMNDHHGQQQQQQQHHQHWENGMVRRRVDE